MYGVPRILFYATGDLLVMPMYSYTLKSLKESNIIVPDESLLSIMQQLVCIIYCDIVQTVSLIIFAFHICVLYFSGCFECTFVVMLPPKSND